MLPIANFDAYTMPIRKKTIFDECLWTLLIFSAGNKITSEDNLLLDIRYDILASYAIK